MDILKLKSSLTKPSPPPKSITTSTTEKSFFLPPSLLSKKEELHTTTTTSSSNSSNSKPNKSLLSSTLSSSDPKSLGLGYVPTPPPPPPPELAGNHAQYQLRQRVLQELLGDDALLSPIEVDKKPEDEFDASLLVHMDEDMQKFQNSLVEEVIGKGMDLKEYTSNLTERLSKVEEELVRDYIASVPQLADLETKISSCEVFLDKMNSLLVGFQKDLGQVSKEIETLQTSNNQLTVSWKNRFTLQSQLSEVIDQTLVSPELIQSILEAEINETYLKHIENLNARMHYVKNNKNTRMRAFRDVGPELERLRNKSAERIREFLIDKLKPLRQINTNIQMIQTNVLLKQAPLNLFLMQWHREMALEIRQHYILTVSKYYASLMEKYIRGLQKRLIPVFDRQDLLGVEELSKDTTLLLNFMKSNPTTQTPPKMKNVFAIATRAMVLRDFDAPVIIVHIAEEQDLKFPIEVLFRSLTRMLLDLCSMEYAFCADFFVNQRKEMGPPHAIATSVFQLITEATLKMALQSIETWCSLSYDLIGMILATKVHLCHRTLLLQRNLHIDTFSTFMENVQDILVHRYTQLMDLHVVSLKKCKFTSKQIQLHYATGRFSDIMCGILFLDLEPLFPKFLLLRQAFELFLQTAKHEFSSKQDGLATLILNYDHIVAVLEEKIGPSDTLTTELSHWHKLFHHATMDYIDEALQPEFGYLIQFVNETELSLETTDAPMFEKISNQFNPTWRASISTLSSEVMRKFSAAKYASSILQALLSQIVVSWERYHVLLDKKFKKGALPFRNQPVGSQNLMLELKKYQTTY